MPTTNPFGEDANKPLTWSRFVNLMEERLGVRPNTLVEFIQRPNVGNESVISGQLAVVLHRRIVQTQSDIFPYFIEDDKVPEGYASVDGQLFKIEDALDKPGPGAECRQYRPNVGPLADAYIQQISRLDRGRDLPVVELKVPNDEEVLKTLREKSAKITCIKPTEAEMAESERQALQRGYFDNYGGFLGQSIVGKSKDTVPQMIEESSKFKNPEHYAYLDAINNGGKILHRPTPKDPEIEAKVQEIRTELERMRREKQTVPADSEPKDELHYWKEGLKNLLESMGPDGSVPLTAIRPVGDPINPKEILRQIEALPQGNPCNEIGLPEPNPDRRSYEEWKRDQTLGK